MSKKYFRFIFLTMISVLFLFPQKAAAEEEPEYDFNKKANVTIKEADCHAVSGNYTWLKYTPKSDGYLTVKVSAPEGVTEPSKGYLALYSSTKSIVLSSKSIFYNTEYSANPYWRQIAFGLQKGRTYYIRVKGENGVKLSRTFKKVKQTSGISREKAKKLSKNKTITAIVPAGISNTDWYKVTLTKKQRLNLYYNVKTRGSFKISIYSSKQLIGSKNLYYTQKLRKLTLYIKTSGKKTGLDKGTYFIKVERANSDSSGYYKLKWN